MPAVPAQINHSLVFVARTFSCAGIGGSKDEAFVFIGDTVHPLPPPAWDKNDAALARDKKDADGCVSGIGTKMP